MSNSQDKHDLATPDAGNVRITFAWILILCAVGSLFSFPVVMTTLAPYDDEGYVMMTLRSFHAGHRLYGSTHTQYGPAFYFLTDSLHGWLRVPLDHDGVRLKTIAFWCLATSFAFASMRRVGVPAKWSFLMALLFHLHLDKLGLEPGHPQEWILLLTVIAIWFVAGNSRWKWSLAASCVALIGMTKLNCGVIVGLPLMMQAIASGYTSQHSKWAWLQVAAVGGAVTSCLLGVALASGSSLQELAWGLVGQHRRFTNEFYQEMPFSMGGVGFLVISLGMLCQARTRGIAGLPLVGIALFGGIAAILGDITRPLVHGLEPRGAAPWLVLVGPALVPWFCLNHTETATKWFLSGLICLGPLMAFPTPGTQLSLATAPAWLMLGSMVGQYNPRGLQYAMSTRLTRSKLTSWVVIVSLGLVLSIVWSRWICNIPLNVEGSNFVRLEAVVAKRETEIAQAIRSTGCEYLVFDGHSHNRFYFWTQTKPLTAANPTFWPRMLTATEQLHWSSAIGSHKRLCVVLPPEHQLLAGNFAVELRKELLTNWTEVAHIDGWRVGVRTEK